MTGVFMHNNQLPDLSSVPPNRPPLDPFITPDAPQPIQEIAAEALSSASIESANTLPSMTPLSSEQGEHEKVEAAASPVVLGQIVRTISPNENASAAEIKAYLDKWVEENPEENFEAAQVVKNFIDELNSEEAEDILVFTNNRTFPPVFHTQLIRENVKRLQIASSQLREVPAEIVQLQNLENICLSCNAKELPKSLFSLPNLQQLRVLNCDRLQSIPEEIGQLAKLTLLEIMQNPQLTDLPKEIGHLTALQQLTLRKNHLTELPHEIGNLQNLLELEVSEEHISQLPQEIGQLASLHNLSLRGAKRITRLPQEVMQLSPAILDLKDCTNLIDIAFIEHFKDLQALNLSGLSQITRLPKGLTNMRYLDLSGCLWLEDVSEINTMSQLTALDLSSCTGIIELPATKNFHSLHTLVLHGLTQFTELEEAIFEAPNLERVELVNCRELIKLPKVLIQHPLKMLNLQGCDRLQTIPADATLPVVLAYLGKWVKEGAYDENRQQTTMTILQFLQNLPAITDLQFDANTHALPDIFNTWFFTKHLTSLSVRSKHIKSLPPSISHLINLKQLDLVGCGQISTLPSVSKFKQLTDLDLVNCSLLTHLPEGIGELTALKTLILNHTGLTEIPIEIGQLRNLEVLFLYGCRGIMHLPEEIGDCSRLRVLSLRDLSQLTTLPKAIGRLVQLELLNLSGCRRLTQLPREISNLGQLREVWLAGCNSLTELPEEIGGLQALQRLDLADARSITQLPSRIGSLENIQLLILKGCVGLTHLPQEIGNLKELKELYLDGCEQLEEVPQTINQLQELVILNLKDCFKIIELPSIDKLTKLRELHLSNLRVLRQLPEGLGELSELRILDLHHCQSLEDLPGAISSLAKLEVLDLSDCVNLRELPNTGPLKELEYLNLAHLTQFRELPRGVAEGRKIFSLDLSGWANLTALPEEIGQLINLQHLVIDTPNQIKTLPQGFYTIQDNRLIIKIPRATTITAATEHLRRFIYAATHAPQIDDHFKSYIRYFSESGIDMGGLSRDFWFSILPNVAKETENQNPLLVKSDEGYYQLFRSMGSTFTEEDQELCENIGKFLAANLLGFMQHYSNDKDETIDYLIGSVFPLHFYTALMYLSQHPFGPQDNVKAQEQSLCFILAKYNPDGKKIGAEALFNIPDDIRTITTKREEELTLEDKQQLRRIWEIIDITNSSLDEEDLPLAFQTESFKALSAFSSPYVRSIVDEQLDDFAGLFFRALTPETAEAAQQTILEAAYADYRETNDFCTPLIAVEKGLREFVPGILDSFINNRDVPDLAARAKVLADAIQGPPFSREACVRLLENASVSDQSTEVRDILLKWCTEGVEGEIASDDEMKMLLRCFTGSEVISPDLTLTFNEIKPGLTMFHTCFGSVDPGQLLLMGPHRPRTQIEIVHRWVEDMHEALGGGFHD